MRVFQIWNNEVTVIDSDKTYIDSFDHFVDDGGRHDLPKKVIYDENQKCCVVDDRFLPYPNQDFESIIASIDSLQAARDKREPELEPSPIDPRMALTADYTASARDLSNAFTIACLRGDVKAQESIKSDFIELQEAYKEEMEELKDEI